MDMTILKGDGEMKIGSAFFSYGHTIPEGQYAPVWWGEYTNGGRGWSSIQGRTYKSLDSLIEDIQKERYPDRWEELVELASQMKREAE